MKTLHIHNIAKLVAEHTGLERFQLRSVLAEVLSSAKTAGVGGLRLSFDKKAAQLDYLIEEPEEGLVHSMCVTLAHAGPLETTTSCFDRDVHMYVSEVLNGNVINLMASNIVKTTICEAGGALPASPQNSWPAWRCLDKTVQVVYKCGGVLVNIRISTYPKT